MSIVRYSLKDGKELTPEEQEAARLRIKEAAMQPYNYDPDSPLLTENQLAEFKPVHFTSMEERAAAMKNTELATADK